MISLTRADEIGAGPFDSIAWALETHCGAADTGEYNFAILYGNEDAPQAIQFWRAVNPDHNAPPDWVWEPAADTGEAAQGGES